MFQYTHVLPAHNENDRQWESDVSWCQASCYPSSFNMFSIISVVYWLIFNIFCKQGCIISDTSNVWVLISKSKNFCVKACTANWKSNQIFVYGLWWFTKILFLYIEKYKIFISYMKLTWIITDAIITTVIHTYVFTEIVTEEQANILAVVVT